MAVSKDTIKTSLLTLYNTAKVTEMTEEQFADSMATIIQAAILSAQVSAGIVVQVNTGTGTGATTGTGVLT